MPFAVGGYLEDELMSSVALTVIIGNNKRPNPALLLCSTLHTLFVYSTTNTVLIKFIGNTIFIRQ